VTGGRTTPRWPYWTPRPPPPTPPRRGLPDASAATLAADPGVVRQIQAGIADGNTRLARIEQVKRFRILPAFWEPGGDELTLTMKLRRKPITQKYAAEIEALYADSPGAGVLEPEAVPAPVPVPVPA
jgi:hypothetical protein